GAVLGEDLRHSNLLANQTFHGGSSCAPGRRLAAGNGRPNRYLAAKGPRNVSRAHCKIKETDGIRSSGLSPRIPPAVHIAAPPRRMIAKCFERRYGQNR